MIGRREFLGCAALAGSRGAASAIRRDVFVRSPGRGTAVMAHAVYTRARGTAMLSFESRMSRADTADTAFVRRSGDNGRTWGTAEERRTHERQAGGMLRRHLRGGWVEPATGRYLEFWNEGILPTDRPLEGLRNWNVFCRVSQDGGSTWLTSGQIIHEGAEYHSRHPLPGVYTGKSCVMLGALTCQPAARKDGAVLLPAQVSPLDAEGKPYNPTGGYTYTDAVVLIGQWRGPRLAWRMSRPVKGDPARSTRGMVEPTLASLANGRLMMVLRGSNDRNPRLPAHKWIAYSDDGGESWTPPEPWTFTSGRPFFSPSACSQLLPHSGGRLFWLGNVTPENARGNLPRYPFVIGEVDRESGLLVEETLRVVDDRQPGESEMLTLSNCLAREDRENGDLCVHMTRLFAFAAGWVGDAFLYRIPLKVWS